MTDERVGYWNVLASRWMWVSVGTGLYWLASQALRPLLAIRVAELGGSELMVGFIIALLPLSSLALAIPGGRLVDRTGVRVIGLTGLGLMGLVGFAVAEAASTAVIAGLVAIMGIAELGAWLSLQALASRGGEGRFLTLQLSLFSLAWGIGVALGPLVGARLYERAGFQAVGWVYGAAALLAGVCAIVAPRVTRVASSAAGPQKIGTSLRGMWHEAPVRATLLSSFVVLFILGVKNSFFPLYLEREGVRVSTIGALLSVIGVTSLVVRLVVPWLLRRLGPRRTLVLSMWLSLTPMALVPAVSGVPLWAMASGLCGLGLGINPPVTVELVARFTQASERGLAMGLRLVANRGAQVVQPLLLGTAIPIVGYPFAFAACGVLLGGVTVWAGRQTFPDGQRAS